MGEPIIAAMLYIGLPHTHTHTLTHLANISSYSTDDRLHPFEIHPHKLKSVCVTPTLLVHQCTYSLEINLQSTHRAEPEASV